MRIAIIVGAFPVLSETFILSLITGLIDRGHDLDIISLDYPAKKNKKVHPVVEQYRLLDRTHYLQVPPNILRRLGICLKLLLKNFWKNPSAILDSLNVFKYGKQAAFLWRVYPLLVLLDRGSYDIVHCQFGVVALRVLDFVKSGVLKGRLVVSLRGSDISRHLKQEGRDVYNQLFEAADLFLPVSKYFKNRLIQLGCNKKTIVFYDSVSCDKFFYDPCPPAEDTVRIVTTGRLVEKKGIEYSIRAMAKVLKTHPNVSYSIIGYGPLHNELQGLIQDLGVGGQVKFLGAKKQEEVVEIIRNSHLYLGPSVTAENGDQEGIPTTLKEAMAMGLPVVTTFHAGIPEMVEDGVSGFLVEERSVDCLAEKLNYLIEHPELWNAMGQAGRARIEEHFETNKLNDRLVEIYEQILK